MTQIINVMGRTDRVESGSVQFVYADGRADWSGFFLRGDNYMGMQMYLQSLESIINKLPDDDKNAQGAKLYLEFLKGMISCDDVIEGINNNKVEQGRNNNKVELKNVEDYLRENSISDGFCGKDDEKALQELKKLSGLMDGTWVPISVAMIAVKKVLSNEMSYKGMSWYKPDEISDEQSPGLL